MRVIEHFTSSQIEELHSLYQGEWWSKGRSLSDTQKCIQGSQITLGVVDENDRLIGFCRVLSDFIFKALIFDLIVNSKHREKGVSATLINQVKSHSRLSEVKHFELYCVPELFSLYQKYDFTSEVGDIHLMRYLKS